MKACDSLREKILAQGAKYLECDVEEVDFDGQKVFMRSKDVSISLKEIGNRVMTNNEEALVAAGHILRRCHHHRLWSEWQK